MKLLKKGLLMVVIVLLKVGLDGIVVAPTAQAVAQIPGQENLTTLSVGVLYQYAGGEEQGVPDKTVVQVFNLEGTLVVEGNTRGSGRVFELPYGTYVVDAYIPFWDGNLRLLCNEVQVTIDSTVIDNGALVRCPVGYAWIYMPFLKH